MKTIPFRSIDKFCRQLAAAGDANGALVDKILGQGIQQRVVDRDSLPLIIQRLVSTHGSWATALRALESGQLDRHRVARDPNIWRTIEQGLPENDAACRESVQKALRSIYGKK